MTGMETGKEKIDREWIQLVIEAKKIGIEKEEIREFFINNSAKEIIAESR